jgi:PAS domain S-box-containing protein
MKKEENRESGHLEETEPFGSPAPQLCDACVGLHDARQTDILSENASEMIWITDLYLKTTYVSPSVTNILGYDVQEVMGKPLQQTLTRESFGNVAAAVAENIALERRGMRSPAVTRSLRVQQFTKTGKRLGMRMALTFIRGRHGAPRGILATIRPLPDKRAESGRGNPWSNEQRADELLKINEQLRQEISERRKAEDAFRQTERRYRQVVEKANDMIYATDADGYFTLINPMALRVTGYTEEELLGRHYTVLMPGEYKKQAETFYGLQFVKKRPDTYHELPIRTKSGEIMWFGQNTQLLMEGDKICGFQSIARDITERKRAEKRLRDSEKRFRLLAEALPIGLSVMGKNTRFQYVNPKFTEIFGYTIDDLPDMKTWFRKAHPEKSYRKTVQGIWNKELFGKGPTSGEMGPCVFNVRCKNGEDKVIQFRAVVAEDRDYILTYEDITCQARTEQALQESEIRYRTLFEAADAAIFLIQAGRVVECNRGAVTMFRINRDNLVGRLVAQLSPELQPDGIPSKVKARRHAEVASHGKTQFFEWQHLRGDGSTFDAEVSLNNMDISGESFTLAIVMDATDRKKSEEALRQSEEKYRTIIENIEEGYYEANREGKILFVNDSACRILGYSRRELVGANYTKFTAEEHKKEVLKTFKSVYQTGNSAKMLRWEIVRKDGSRTSLEASVSLIKDSKGNPVGFRGICRDITERRKSEEMMLKSERLKAVGELSTGVAHNFNNLLQIVMGGAQLAAVHLNRGDITGVRRYLDQILDSARFGSDTVTRLQSFARARPDDAKSGGKVFDLSVTVAQAIEMCKVWWQPTSEKNGIALTVAQELAPGCVVKGRESELFEVAVNLIKNAVEALPHGGEIRVTTSKCGDSVIMRVHDNGAGIPEADLGKVFEPFYTTKGFQSTGMGLAGSYGIVNSHGGELSVDSGEGEGTTFSVRLPRCDERLQDARDGVPTLPPVGLRVLVIDDTEFVLNALREGFSEFGLTALTASSGKEGLEIFKNNSVDLVICDLGMPDMNGWEVGKRIKAHCAERGREKVPCILLTGWGGQLEERPKLAESGFDRVVKKPVDIMNLLQIIEEVFANRDGYSTRHEGSSLSDIRLIDVTRDSAT